MKKLLPTIISIFILLFPALLQARTIHVPGDESTIQNAVNAASNGDTIIVADGTWDGATIKRWDLTIRSENGPQNCIIDYNGRGLEVLGVRVSIDGFTISGDGRGIEIQYGGTSITNCLITDNQQFGIWILGDSTTISNCEITENQQGGISSHGAGTTISNCEISYNINDNQFGGGGIHAWGDFTVENCLFHHNAAWSDNPGVHGQGGAIWCTFSTATISSCTFHSNYAAEFGGAIASSQDHAPAAGKETGLTGSDVITMENCILWGNIAGTAADEAYMWDSALEISYSTVDGGQDSISGNFTWGEGMIEDDPLFVSGSLGDYFLSQIATGQGTDSPCVDSGNPGTPLIDGTTRTDFVLDSGTIDMGWHYAPQLEPEGPFLLAGPGPALDNESKFRVFPPEQGAAHTTERTAYGADRYGVNVTTGDLHGDGTSEIITGAGPGAVFGPHVRGFTPLGDPISGISFQAYGTNQWGVNVACGDLNGDGRDEIITGAGPGTVFGPHVRGWSYDGVAISPMAEVNYSAYGVPNWGVNVAAGDIDGDGYDEIVTGPGPGDVYGPHVRGWNVDGSEVEDIQEVSYLAYGTPRKGVNVACGDVDGDGIDEIVTGAGPSMVFGAHVKGWNYDGGTLTEIPGINFFAWQPGESLYGVTVSAMADFNGDGRSEIVTGQGPDPSAGTVVRVFSYDLVQTTLLFHIDAFGDSGMTQGVNTAAGSN